MGSNWFVQVAASQRGGSVCLAPLLLRRGAFRPLGSSHESRYLCKRVRYDTAQQVALEAPCLPPGRVLRDRKLQNHEWLSPATHLCKDSPCSASTGPRHCVAPSSVPCHASGIRPHRVCRARDVSPGSGSRNKPETQVTVSGRMEAGPGDSAGPMPSAFNPDKINARLRSPSMPPAGSRLRRP